MNLRKKFIGDKAFYAMVFTIVVPMIVQNGISSFVNLLDNIMVGQTGTEMISGVSIGGQLIFIFNICVFGGISGAGIFTAQFFGKQDYEGVRATFRIKLYIVALLLAVFVTGFFIFGERLIGLFLNQEDVTGDAALTLQTGTAYLKIMLVGLIPFGLSQVYCSTLREGGETMLPMKASIAAVLVNLVFNYLLIFGNFGFPKWGVQGAAVATVLSRFVELAVVLIGAHARVWKYPFLDKVYRSMRVSAGLLKQVLLKGMPLLVNEALWSVGMTMITQCYSTRGLAVIAALNISNVISQLFNMVFMSMGSAISILVGQRLGAGEMEQARDLDNKIIAFGVMGSTATAVLLSLAAPYIPLLYNTDESVRQMATQLIWVAAIFLPVHNFCHSSYFTLRSGGKTMLTFFFDCGFLWLASIPAAYFLSRFTNIPVIMLYTIVQLTDLLKAIGGFFCVKSDLWMHNIVKDT